MPVYSLSIQTFPARRPSTQKPDLLFVHGGYVNAKCWLVHLVPFFQAAGFTCHTLDLRGHGQSEGVEHLHHFGIDDYADDVETALASITSPVILIGHSMGCLVIQRYLEREDAQARAAVFMAPVPPSGTAASAMHLTLKYPGFFQAVSAATNGVLSQEHADLMTQIYFSPGIQTAEILRFADMVGPESFKAITEMAFLAMRGPHGHQPLPALVIGGENDAVFPDHTLNDTGLLWNAQVERIGGAGHMFIVDDHHHEACRLVLNWVQQLPSS
jgi:pimeloyl-ACP methyl ester carboxylesterase